MYNNNSSYGARLATTCNELIEFRISFKRKHDSEVVSVRVKVLYQTVRDHKPDKVEFEGPFKCTRANSWLGDGYYFWDTFIENAHWWGKEGRVWDYKGRYIICKAFCDFSDDTCFDLYGSTEHLTDFEETLKQMESYGIKDETTTVSRVITFMKDFANGFPYQACRVVGMHTKGKETDFLYALPFDINRTFQYLDYKPAIQICIYNKNGLNLNNYKIVFPEYYCDGYGI